MLFKVMDVFDYHMELIIKVKSIDVPRQYYCIDSTNTGSFQKAHGYSTRNKFSPVLDPRFY